SIMYRSTNRHTRSYDDWSSDVCSYDLNGNLVGLDDVLAFHAYGVDAVLNKAAGGTAVTPPVAKLDWSTFSNTGMDLSAAKTALRSEERRVGKECGGRGVAERVEDSGRT